MMLTCNKQEESSKNLSCGGNYEITREKDQIVISIEACLTFRLKLKKHSSKINFHTISRSTIARYKSNTLIPFDYACIAQLFLVPVQH